MNADFLLSQVISFTLQFSFLIILPQMDTWIRTSYKLRFIHFFCHLYHPHSLNSFLFSSITEHIVSKEMEKEKLKRDNNHSWCSRCYKWCNLTNFFITETWRKNSTAAVAASVTLIFLSICDLKSCDCSLGKIFVIKMIIKWGWGICRIFFIYGWNVWCIMYDSW